MIIIEPNNTLEICDTQDQHDSIDNSDKAAFTALSNAASDTSVIRSSDASDGIKIFVFIVTLPHEINILSLQQTSYFTNS